MPYFFWDGFLLPHDIKNFSKNRVSILCTPNKTCAFALRRWSIAATVAAPFFVAKYNIFLCRILFYFEFVIYILLIECVDKIVFYYSIFVLFKFIKLMFCLKLYWGKHVSLLELKTFINFISVASQLNVFLIIWWLKNNE